MKKLFKTLFYLFLVAVVAVSARYTYFYFFDNKNRTEAMSIIPDDAVFIVETSNITKAWNQISDSKVWAFLIKNPYFADINESMDLLNKYLKKNKLADYILNDRELSMSAHMISAKDWDFLFVVDLESAFVIKNDIKLALGMVDGYNTREIDYKNYKIIELTDVNDKNSSFYITTVNNLLVVSFKNYVLENALDKFTSSTLIQNKRFIEVNNDLKEKKLFRFYFNYSQLDKFSKVYTQENSETINMLAKSLKFSAFNINLKDELLSFDGYTNLDSVSSYVKALADVKPGKMTAFNIVSDRAAMYLSLGFENFYDFYNNLTEQYKTDHSGEIEDIAGNVNLLEKYLGISLKDNFTDFIGNEIAFVKLRPGINTRLEDVVAVVHTNDIQKAKEGWDLIVDRIGRRTVVKYKTENYKNFEIRILQQKGFFRLFFGNVFTKLEKPYFTYIEDFVVFSNSLETLKTIIDDYVAGNTLSKNSDFKNFMDNFESKSNLSIFIQTPKIYENLYQYSSPEDRRKIHENKDFILSFAMLGFQLVSDGNLFKTKLMAFHDPNAVNADNLEKIEKETTDNLIKDSVENLLFKIIFSSDSLKQNRDYKKYFTDTKNLQIEGQISNNQPNGIWKTYYKSGNIKNTVNYNDSKIEGEVDFFHDNAQKTPWVQAKFENEQITGTYLEFYANGILKAKIEYDDGKPNGNAEFYYPDGRKKIEAKFKNGQKSGKWKYFDLDGNVINKEKWKN
jgi:antitoxin component YwqK of YwqJK toxin-antitoxin module